MMVRLVLVTTEAYLDVILDLVQDVFARQRNLLFQPSLVLADYVTQLGIRVRISEQGELGLR